jgi:uncharacterized paraquat-inducible protein A
MVPFWRRRLLLVSMPVLAFGTLVWIMLGLTTTQKIRRPDMVLDLPTLLTASTLAAPHALVVVVVPLLLAGRTHRGERGIGFGAVGLAISAWVFAMVFVISVGMGTGFGLNVNTSPWLFPGAAASALLAIGIGWVRTAGVAPRTDVASRLCETASAVGGVALCLLVPMLFAKLRIGEADLPGWQRPRDLAGVSLAIYAAIALVSAGLAAAAILRALTLRHAPYHARHCHQCGYDLIGVETTTCPECDHPISPDQRVSLLRKPPA